MGCDIHCYGERRVNGAWQVFDGPRDSFSRYDENAEVIGEDGEPTGERMRRPLTVYSGRNYALFTILAGVRDYGGNQERISNPRGVPPDVSPEVGAIFRAWGVDGHSHSWLTLRELVAWRWSEKLTRSGWLDAHSCAEWKARDFADDPYSWCRDGYFRKVSRERMEKFIAGKSVVELAGMSDEGGTPYVHMDWQVMRASVAPDFVTETLHYLHRFVPEGGTLDDVRIVFCFDN